KQLDYLFLGVMGTTLLSFTGLIVILFLGYWLLMLIGLLSPHKADDDLMKSEDIAAILQLQPEKLPDVPIPKQRDKKPAGNPDAGEGDKAKGDEGKRGKADSKIENTRGGAF